MRIACNRCQTRYDIPEDRLKGGAVKVRCSDCGHTFVVRRRAAVEEPPPKRAVAPPAEASFDDFDFGDFESHSPEPSAPPPPPTESDADQTRFKDFDFDGFGESPEKGLSEADAEPAPPPFEEPEPEEESISALGELDLGGLDDLQREFGTTEEDVQAGFPPEAPEPLERVREEELVSDRQQGVQLQGLADEMPHLDIQRGPRRSEGIKPSPLVARDRCRSPLFWVVLMAALAVVAFTGYNIYRHPDKALTFLHPSKIRSLWKMRKMEAHFAVEALRGYYRELPGGRRVFVIRGEVANRSEGPRSLIRVRGNLFGPDGGTVATKEVFCGNVLTEQELATLPEETVEARLQNEVGQTLSNVDIAPGTKVPFMLVFPSPPEGVEKFNVAVTEARAGAGS